MSDDSSKIVSAYIDEENYVGFYDIRGNRRMHLSYDHPVSVNVSGDVITVVYMPLNGTGSDNRSPIREMWDARTLSLINRG